MATTTIKDGFSGGSDAQLKINPDGSINVSSSSPTGNVSMTGLNQFQTEQYTIGQTAIELTPTPLANRSSITIRVSKDNTGAIYIGNSNLVTISNGYPLFAGDTLGMDLTPGSTIYAISNTVDQSLAVLEIA